MGGSHSNTSGEKSRSSNDVEHIRPTAEQRTPKNKTKSTFTSIAQSSRHLSKFSFKLHRKCGSRDKAKCFRELIASWPIEDVETLYREFYTCRVLNDLKEESDDARPPVPSIGYQLLQSETQNYKIIFKNEKFRVHRRLISVRCDRIKDMMTDISDELNITALIDSLNENISASDLRNFIKFIYTEEENSNTAALNKKMRQLFGCKRSLEEDLLSAARLGTLHGDLSLILTIRTMDGCKEDKAYLPEFSIRCDSEIVGARSSLLHGLLSKRDGSRVVLDESLLPRGFAPLVLHFLYTDKLELSKISESAISQSSLSEARAIVAGRSPHSPLHRAIQLIHVAKFFGLDRLVHLCEDVMIESLCIDSCVSVLSWALDGGSQYVARQALRYVESEFSKIAQSHHLFDLSITSLASCVQSQFLQATEVEILEAVVRWGEHELLKRMEEREPNIVADTSHSISRRGVRRSELCGKELREILGPLTVNIRTDYVLPPFHQSLNKAYSRGILERAPLKDLVCPSTSEINPDIHWFRPVEDAPGPRFYHPYYKAAISHLRVSHEKGETLRLTSCEKDELTPVVCSKSEESLQVHISNLQPHVLDEAKFNEVRGIILDRIDQLDKQYQIRNFPREFHKTMAVHLISLGVVRRMDIDEETIGIRLLNSKSTCSNWPDVVTLERRPHNQQKDDEQKSGEYDPIPDDLDSTCSM